MPGHVRQHARRAAAEALWRFNRDIIDAVHDLVPVVKPQLAFYERYGLAGMQAYVQTVRYARDAGLLVIADGKRNDIGPTAVGYAQAFLGPIQVFEQMPGDFEVDALTVNAFWGVTASRRSSIRRSSMAVACSCS